MDRFDPPSLDMFRGRITGMLTTGLPAFSGGGRDLTLQFSKSSIYSTKPWDTYNNLKGEIEAIYNSLERRQV